MRQIPTEYSHFYIFHRAYDELLHACSVARLLSLSLSAKKPLISLIDPFPKEFQTIYCNISHFGALISVLNSICANHQTQFNVGPIYSSTIHQKSSCILHSATKSREIVCIPLVFGKISIQGLCYEFA